MQDISIKRYYSKLYQWYSYNSIYVYMYTGYIYLISNVIAGSQQTASLVMKIPECYSHVNVCVSNLSPKTLKYKKLNV